MFHSGRYGPSFTSKINEWYDYTEDYENYIKDSILNNTNDSPPSAFAVTTGASNKFIQKNIYDLAGNFVEYTLEHISDDSWNNTGILRGGGLGYKGDFATVSHRLGGEPGDTFYGYGFRVCIY